MRPRAHPRRASAVAAATGVLALVASGCTGTPEPTVTTLPEVTLERFDGPGSVDLADVRGPAVVNLWASWCGPCRAELPLVEQFHERHGDEVDVIGVDYQDVQVDAARALAERSGLTYELLRDPDGTLDGAAPFPPLPGLPFWAVVDADGTVVHQEFVVIESVAQLEDLVTEQLGADVLDGAGR